jgi:hypothetical protein
MVKTTRPNTSSQNQKYRAHSRGRCQNIRGVKNSYNQLSRVLLLVTSVLILTHHMPGIGLLLFLSSWVVKYFSLWFLCYRQLPRVLLPARFLHRDALLMAPRRHTTLLHDGGRSKMQQWWLQRPDAPSSTVSAARGVGDVEEATTHLHL